MAKPVRPADDFAAGLSPHQKKIFNACIEQEAQKSAEILKIMHIIESISTKIHALTDTSEIYRTVTSELAAQSHYKGAILLLDGKGKRFFIASMSYDKRILRSLKKSTGISADAFSFPVRRSPVYRRVAAGETLHVPSIKVLRNVLPAPLALIVAKGFSYQNTWSVLNPLRVHGKVIGVFSMSGPGLSAHIVPSISNLARHISLSLELADEIKRRREAEHRALSILEGVGEAITIHDFDGRVIQVNSEFENGIGYRREEVIGKSPIELGWVTPEQQKRIHNQIIPKLMKTGRAFDEELTAHARNGRTFPTSVNWSLMRDETGKPVAIINAAKDISRLKAAEAMLRDFSKKMLAVREEEKKKLSTDLHDELGTMVVALTSSLSLAEEELKNCGTVDAVRFHLRQARQLIVNYVGRLKGIVLDLRPPQLDLIGLSAALRELFDNTGKRQGFRIEFKDRLGDIKIANENSIALYRVAQEALSNAVLHSDAQLITAEVVRRGRNIELQVRDNGCGFNADKILRQPGNLGLMGMRERMEARNGNLAVVSRPGKGTLIRATLPETLGKK